MVALQPFDEEALNPVFTTGKFGGTFELPPILTVCDLDTHSRNRSSTF